MKQTLRDKLCQHLKASGLKCYPKHLRYLMRVRSRFGVEHACEVQKQYEEAVKSAFLRGIYHTPGLGMRNRITHIKDGKPVRVREYKSATLRELIPIALKCHANGDYSSQFAVKVSLFLKTSNIFRLSRTSKLQVEKAFASITSHPVAPDDVIDEVQNYSILFSKYEDKIFKPFNDIGLKLRKGQIPDMLSWYRPGKFSPTGPTTASEEQVPHSQSKVFSPGLFLQWAFSVKWSADRICRALSDYWGFKVTPQWVIDRRDHYFSITNDPKPIAGKITFLQEPKCKARVIANPYLFLQVFTEPYKAALEMINRNIWQICTFDQPRGLKFLFHALAEHQICYCYDASSFTDRFPYELQRLALNKLNFDTSIIDEIVQKSFWFTKVDGKVEYLKYSIGQPMGLGPSFHLATFTHYAMLVALCYELEIPTNTFMVNGDDVIIINSRLAQAYYTSINRLGVEINGTKSIISSVVGEFLGHIVTNKGQVIPPIKFRKDWKLLPQYVAAINFYGRRALKFLPKCDEVRAAIRLPYFLGGSKLTKKISLDVYIKSIMHTVEQELDSISDLLRIDIAQNIRRDKLYYQEFFRLQDIRSDLIRAISGRNLGRIALGLGDAEGVIYKKLEIIPPTVNPLSHFRYKSNAENLLAFELQSQADSSIPTSYFNKAFSVDVRHRQRLLDHYTALKSILEEDHIGISEELYNATNGNWLNNIDIANPNRLQHVLEFTWHETLTQWSTELYNILVDVQSSYLSQVGREVKDQLLKSIPTAYQLMNHNLVIELADNFLSYSTVVGSQLRTARTIYDVGNPTILQDELSVKTPKFKI